jgi:hypothetical protein
VSVKIAHEALMYLNLGTHPWRDGGRRSHAAAAFRTGVLSVQRYILFATIVFQIRVANFCEPLDVGCISSDLISAGRMRDLGST